MYVSTLSEVRQRSVPQAVQQKVGTLEVSSTPLCLQGEKPRVLYLLPVNPNSASCSNLVHLWAVLPRRRGWYELPFFTHECGCFWFGFVWSTTTSQLDSGPLIKVFWSICHCYIGVCVGEGGLDLLIWLSCGPKWLTSPVLESMLCHWTHSVTWINSPNLSKPHIYYL